MEPGALRKAFFLTALLFCAARAGAVENVFVVSDTVSHFERVFAARSRLSAWFGNGNASTINFSYAGKANVNFRLAEPEPGVRYVDQIQVEPQGPLLSTAQATAFIRFLMEDLSRQGNVLCKQVRDDQDGMNAFILYSCAEKGKPEAPAVEVMNTIQTVDGRNTLFVQFTPKKK